MDTIQFKFKFDPDSDDQIEDMYDQLSALGAYDITDEEVEPPTVLPHNRQKKPNP